MANETTNQEVPERLLTEFKEHSYEEWRAAVDKLLKGKPYEKIMLTKTYEGIQLEPIYRREDTQENPLINSLPGEFPYVRSTKKLGYLEKPWNVAQEIPCSLPKEFNEALLSDLNRGQTAVNMLLDNATMTAIDPDQAKPGEVGCTGLSISSLEDLKIALNKVVVNCIDIDIHAYSSGMYLTAMLAALAKKQNIPTNELSGSIGADPISQLVKNGTLPTSITNAYDEMYLSTKWANENAPKLRTIAVHSDAFINGGASVVEELTNIFGIAIEYVNAMLERGLSIDDVANKFQFNLSLGSNFFMEIAKVRAARVLWANIVSAYGGNEESQKMYIHGRTATWNKTKYDPYVNMLRTTTEAFSGVMGGVDSLHVGHFDEVLRKPDEFSRRIARNQQIMLNEECHFNHVIDPVGGSWYIETLTSDISEKIWEEIQALDNEGGFFTALKNNKIQEKIDAVAKARLKNANVRRDVIVGTNMFANMTETRLEERNDDKNAIYALRLKEISEVKSGDYEVSTFESIIDAFLKGATIGQISASLRKTTECEKVTAINNFRIAEHFEALREKVENLDAKPKVFLAGMGSVKQYKPRLDFSRGFFEVGSLDVSEKGGFKTPEEAGEFAVSQNASAYVICSTDATYPELVPGFVKTIKEKQPNAVIVLAGFPKDQLDAHKESGVDIFIHARANVFETISSLLEKIGVAHV